jgi:transposase
MSKDVALALDIHPLMLSRWRKEYREGKFKNVPRYKSSSGLMSEVPSKKELNKIKQLQKENERLKQENDLLKKWQQYLAEVHQSDLDSSKPTEKT